MPQASSRVEKTSNVHPTAVVADGARVDGTAVVGAYCVVGGEVHIGKNTNVGPHTIISGRTRIGDNNVIHGFCSIGGAPQHVHDQGVDCELIIGDGNTFREFCTLNRGTAEGGGKTVIGDHNFVMAYVHVAHDCILGDHIILVNNATLGGHVEVNDHAVIGGLTLVHQWCKVGRYAFTGRLTALVQDLPPFTTATGSPAQSYGLNVTGLRRHQFSNDLISALKRIYKQRIRRKQQLSDEQLAALAEEYPEVQEFIDFIEASERGIVSSAIADY